MSLNDILSFLSAIGWRNCRQDSRFRLLFGFGSIFFRSFILGTFNLGFRCLGAGFRGARSWLIRHRWRSAASSPQDSCFRPSTSSSRRCNPKSEAFSFERRRLKTLFGYEFSRVRTSFHLKASLQSLFALESSRAASVSQSPWAGPASSWPARRNTNGLAQARAHESAAATGLGRF